MNLLVQCVLGYHFQPANLCIVLWGYCLSCCSLNNSLVFPCLWNSLQIYIKCILFRGNCQNYFRYLPLYSLFCCFSSYICILLLRGMLLLLWFEICQNSTLNYSQLSLSKSMSLFFLLMGQVWKRSIWFDTPGNQYVTLEAYKSLCSYIYNWNWWLKKYRSHKIYVGEICICNFLCF